MAMAQQPPRRLSGLKGMQMSETYVGIDVGGTNIKIGLFDSELKMICKTSITTNAEMGPEIVINNMAQTVEELITGAGLSLQDVVAIGIGTPGPAKYSEGIIIRSTNMPKFKNVQTWLAGANMPSEPVRASKTWSSSPSARASAAVLSATANCCTDATKTAPNWDT